MGKKGKKLEKNMDAQLEELESRVDDKIVKLSLQNACEAAQGLGIDSKEYKDKSIIAVRRALRKYLEQPTDDADEKKVLLEKVEKVVDQFVVPSDAGPDSIEGSKKTDQVVITGANSLLRRECKIAGQIGPPDARDKLTYVSLMRQIQECEEKGYQESEIVSAIIRAMVPGLQLRSYLESTPPNPLKRLKKILRSHFQEKSATELYQELTNMTQRPDEDALAFLLRAFELRSKVCLASGEEGSLQYDVTLVNGLTAHTIETGLSPENENI